MCSVSQFAVVLSLRLTFFCRLNTNLSFFNSNQELSHDCQNILISLCSKSQSAPPTMAVLWKHLGQRGSWAEAGRPLGSSVLLYGSQLWPGLCNAPSSYIHISPTVNPTKHRLYTHAPLLGLFQPCQVADCCASLNQSLLSPEYVFIVDYSCVFWPVSGCVAQFLCNCRCQKNPQNNKLTPPISHTLLLFYLF